MNISTAPEMPTSRIRRLFNRQNLRVYRKNLITAVLALTVIVSYVAFAPFLSLDLPVMTGTPGAPPQTSAGNASQEAAGGQVPFGSRPPEGVTINPDGSIQLPEGFTLPPNAQLPEGFSINPDGSIQVPEGFTPPAGMPMPPMGQFGQDVQPPASTSGGQALPTAPEGMPGAGPNFQVLVLIAGVVGLAMALISASKPRFNTLATSLTFVGALLGLVYYALFFVQDPFIPIELTELVNAGFWIGLVGTTGLALQLFIPRPREVHADDSNVGKILDKRQTSRSGMSLQQNLAVALDALMANKLRSGLTMLGIIIGVGSVVALMSVGQGAQSSITEQITSTGVNLVTISPGAGGIGPGAAAGGGGNSVGSLTYQDAEAIAAEIDGISDVLPQFSSSFTARSEQGSYTATVLGTVWNHAEARFIDVEIGSYFSDSDYRSRKRVAVLGSAAVEELFGGLNPIGDYVRIDGQRFEIVGVLDEQDGGFGQDPNLQIYVPLSTGYRYLFDAQARGSSDDTVTSIVVAVEDSDNVSAVVQDIEALLRERHDLEADEESDFNVIDQQQLLSTAGNITGILTVLLGAIASISLIVGGIGIMNISLVSVTERTKEIGLRKAIGARRSHILQQFLIETVFLSVVGGLVGVAIGVGIAYLVDQSGLISTTVSATSILLGLGSSIIIGIFFGVYPANQAASLEPIEALRYE